MYSYDVVCSNHENNDNDNNDNNRDTKNENHDVNQKRHANHAKGVVLVYTVVNRELSKYDLVDTKMAASVAPAPTAAVGTASSVHSCIVC